MTIWKDDGWELKYKERLGNDVYKFVEKDPKLVTYLSDYDYINKKLKAGISSHELDDNSMFVLHICKFFEGVLHLIADETGWYKKYSKGNPPIRMFFLNSKNRTSIENEIRSISTQTQTQNNIIDKLFSTVDDFTERHKAVHFGSMLKVGEIDNYDAILTKVRDVIKVLMDNNIIT